MEQTRSLHLDGALKALVMEVAALFITQLVESELPKYQKIFQQSCQKWNQEEGSTKEPIPLRIVTNTTTI